MMEFIIFDLDGTLVDSSKDITNALNYAIKSTGLHPLSVQEAENLIGEGITRLIEKLLPPEFILQRDQVLENFLEYYSNHLVDHTVPYPSVKQTLKNLTLLKKAVVSNKRELLSRMILQGLDLIQFFDDILGGDSVAEKKPSPVPIITLLNKLSISRERTIIVGDSAIDVQTGKNAGIKTVAVTYGYQPKEKLKNADFLIDNMSELEKIVMNA